MQQDIGQRLFEVDPVDQKRAFFHTKCLHFKFVMALLAAPDMC